MNFLTGDDAPAPAETAHSGMKSKILELLDPQAWESGIELARQLNYRPHELRGPLLSLLIKDQVEMRPRSSVERSEFRLKRDRTGNARRAVSIPIWSPWTHISGLSGELTVGRVCLDIYVQFSRLRWGLRVNHDAKRFARSYTFTSPVAHAFLRRWR